jgi:hypothetical protein
MQLPGGLWEEDRCHTEASFREPTGAMQLDVARCAGIGDPTERVTAILNAAVATVGGTVSTRERLGSMCVDDRRWLMLQLAALLGPTPIWLTDSCGQCGASFDIPFEPARVPAKPAGDGYPFAVVTTKAGALRLCVPTGTDQHAVAGLPEEEALDVLIERCCAAGGSRLDRQLSASDLRRVSAELEKVSPQVALTVSTACPACGAPSEPAIDPYGFVTVDESAILDDVHVLARGYGWSEAQILDLSASRRREYRRRLEQDPR